jgi:hypothetical protein
MTVQGFDEIAAGFGDGKVIPYLGCGVLALNGPDVPPPGTPAALVAKLTAKTTVPHKVRNNLTGAAQYIENFKHRKTLTKMMIEAFAVDTPPTELHHLLAAIPALPLLVHAWYDDLPQKAFAARRNWGIVQGVSQTEHFGRWTHYFRADGTPLTDAIPSIVADEPAMFAPAPDEAAAWSTLLYQPLGSVVPAANFLVSDSDFVEVMTEIDIQTPVPLPVQQLRKDRHFLFLGCRFDTQLDRVFARQIMKRSSDRHWAVLPESPSRYEARFLEEQNIARIELPLSDFVAALAEIRHDRKLPA